MTFGQNLLRLREKAKLTQCELSARSGIAQSTISTIESGCGGSSIDAANAKVTALAMALEVAEEELRG